jgi:hypothetical protein
MLAYYTPELKPLAGNPHPLDPDTIIVGVSSSNATRAA